MSDRILILEGKRAQKKKELVNLEVKIENEVNAVMIALPLPNCLEDFRMDRLRVAFTELEIAWEKREKIMKEIKGIEEELG